MQSVLFVQLSEQLAPPQPLFVMSQVSPEGHVQDAPWQLGGFALDPQAKKGNVMITKHAST
jgi:hypothetical protein